MYLSQIISRIESLKKTCLNSSCAAAHTHFPIRNPQYVVFVKWSSLGYQFSYLPYFEGYKSINATPISLPDLVKLLESMK